MISLVKLVCRRLGLSDDVDQAGFNQNERQICWSLWDIIIKLNCPSPRHFVSDSLETLASVVVSRTSGQAPKLLDTLIQCPHLSPFLSAHLSPNINNNMEIMQIYKSVCDLSDGDGALPFVLLSKAAISTSSVYISCKVKSSVESTLSMVTNIATS